MPLLWHSSFSSKLIIWGWDLCTVFQNSPSMYFLSLSLLRSEWSTSVTLSPSPDSVFYLHSPVCWRDFPLRLLFGSVSFSFPAFLGFTFLRHFLLYWILFWGLVLTYCFILFFVFILLEYIPGVTWAQLWPFSWIPCWEVLLSHSFLLGTITMG